MARVEFVGQSAQDVSFPTGGTSRLINCYREPMVGGQRAPHMLRAVPGMQDFASLPTVFARAMTTYDGDLAIVAGTNLYLVTPAGALTDVGTVEAPDSQVTMDESAGVLCIGSNLKYWTWDGATLANPTTGAVTDVAGVTQLGGYIIVSEKNDRTFAWSDLVTPGTFSGLNFASAEITPDRIIRPFAFKDALYLFKRDGYERWGVTGQAGVNAFARIEGAMGEPGLLEFNLICEFPNGMAWVGGDGRVHVLGIGPISTPPLEVAIKQSDPSRMFFYEQRGHGFVCITFTMGAAWCYDVATGEWHERSEANGRWSAATSAKLSRAWYVAADSGKVGKLVVGCSDFGLPMIRRAVSNTLEMDDRFSIAKIEAYPRPAGDVQGDGTPAKVTLRMSRDGGMTWGADKDRPVGVDGAWDHRLTWRGLGQFRKAVMELSQSGPTDVPMLSNVDVELS
jgi:hypothetical protein